MSGALKADELRVLAFGDSLTQGYGLPEAEGFVPQLESWLTAHGQDVSVVNGGVSGDTTAGGAARIEWSLSDDIDALIVTLGGNDMLRGLPAEQARANLEAILQIAQGKKVPVMLIGMDAPLNYGKAYKQAFEGLYPELAEAHSLAFVASFMAPLGATPSEALAWMQSDGVHPNAEGVEMIVAELGPEVLAFLKTVEAPEVETGG
ncbi:arylesterase [Lentibacter algarum]|nr:arylesterase [Lentibacter algarum]MBU2980879.1 arylesterase [Lentibacter algarum]